MPFLDLFTPETWQAFRDAGATVTGFRERYLRSARERVNEGDFLLCYLTRLSRWCGILQVESEVYRDDSPIFDDPDPFVVRFRAKPIVVLDHESAIPIHDDKVWSTLTTTNQYQKGTSVWTGPFRVSLYEINKADGEFLVEILKKQEADPEIYPLTDKEKRLLSGRRKIRTLDGEVEVEVPDDDDEESSLESETSEPTAVPDSRTSIQYQAKVAHIGAEMDFHIWVPRNDRARVLELVPESMHEKFLDLLPLNYDDTTLRTVEQIDVLWIEKGRSMARAFEVEHTTAIYSGLLRMADLLALQPNMNIRLHIVAPPDKRERVLREIRRPVFSLLGRGPLYKQCSFLSYDSIDALAKTPYLSHMSDTIINEYDEFSEV
ncbi:MAG: EVE domain-containing protein [Dehalococcoidia bacterium]|nr:EVE domain-containing protein [Dehalococcoidia bacterium]